VKDERQTEKEGMREIWTETDVKINGRKVRHREEDKQKDGQRERNGEKYICIYAQRERERERARKRHRGKKR